MAQDKTGFDPLGPSPARVWNYWIGGREHFAADRAVAERILDVLPEVAVVARMTRGFQARTVEQLAAEHGIRQFLDIGSGLPTAENTHEVAHQVDPECRVVYVDNDRAAIRYAEAMLGSVPGGNLDYLEGDLRDPEAIVKGAARTLDLTKPVAVLLIQVLHFIADSEAPYGLVARLMAGLAPGSFLVIVHAASDVGAEVGADIVDRYNAMLTQQVRMRSHDEVARFFDGLELLGDGVTSGHGWTRNTDGVRHSATSGMAARIRLGAGAAAAARLADADGMSFGHVGIGRKPTA